MAKQIQERKPHNKIDWITTFTVVEKRYFIQELREGFNISSNIGSQFRDVIEEIEFAGNVDPDFGLAVNQRVISNFKKFGFLKRQLCT